jgi:hypothetical protein
MTTENNNDLISRSAALERIESLERKFTGHVVSVNDVSKVISSLPAYPIQQIQTTQNSNEAFDFYALCEKAQSDYLIHTTSVRGQQMTERDDPEWHLANLAWQAASQLKERAIAELKFECASKDLYANTLLEQNAELQTHINKLLNVIHLYGGSNLSNPDVVKQCNYVAQQVISTIEPPKDEQNAN